MIDSGIVKTIESPFMLRLEMNRDTLCERQYQPQGVKAL